MAAVLLLAGCQTTAMVRVDVRPDGSGSVAVDVYLDPEAAAKVGNLPKLLAVGDLTRAGWKVTGPASPEKVQRELEPGRKHSSTGFPKGTVQVHLERPFANPDEANAILESLSGPDGPLTHVSLSRRSSLFETHLRFTGTVDLGKGLDTFGDADLRKVLGGSLSGAVGASGIEKPSGDDLRVGLQIVPTGAVDWSGDKGNDSMGNETITASATLGAAPESIDVHASQTRWGAVIAAAVVVAVVLIGLVVLGFRLRRRANRAERALLPDIEVSDPFAGSGAPTASGDGVAGAGADGDRGHGDASGTGPPETSGTS